MLEFLRILFEVTASGAYIRRFLFRPIAIAHAEQWSDTRTQKVTTDFTIA
jgi:hypothetical protein